MAEAIIISKKRFEALFTGLLEKLELTRFHKRLPLPVEDAVVVDMHRAFLYEVCEFKKRLEEE
jgi:hypothetical protein